MSRRLSKRDKLKPLPPNTPNETPIENSFQKFALVSLYLANDKGRAPVLGNSQYIIVAQKKNQVTLIHPFTLTKFNLTAMDFKLGLLQREWFPEPKRVADLLETLALSHIELKRQAPYSLIREMIAHFRDVPLASVMPLALKASLSTPD